MAKAKQIEVHVITRLQDNGDGGYTLHAYNNENELILDHPRYYEMTDKLRQEILNGEDEYENGYIGSDRIRIEIDGKGNVRLAEPLSFHAGQ